MNIRNNKITMPLPPAIRIINYNNYNMIIINKIKISLLLHILFI